MPFRLYRHDQEALSWEDVEALILAGDLAGSDMVRRDGEQSFVPLRERPEFDHLFTEQAIAARRAAADRRSDNTVLDSQRVKGVECVGGHPDLAGVAPVTVDVAIDNRCFFLLDGEQRLAAITRAKVTGVDLSADREAFVVAVGWEDGATSAITRFRLAGVDGKARADELAMFFRSRRLAV